MRTAEVIFVGDAASVVRAAREASAATEGATAKIAAANAKLGASYMSMSGAGKRAAAELEGSHNKMVSSLAQIGHSSNIAIAGLVGLGAAAYGVKKAADATAEVAKETLLLHNVTGLSVKSASAYASVAKVQGLEVKGLNQAFGTLSKNVHAVENAHEGLTKAAGKQEVAFRQLGLPMSAITKAHGDMNILLPQITSRFEAMPGGIEKAATGMALFGRGWQTLVPLMHSGALGLKEQLDEANKMGATLGGSSVKSLKDFAKAQEQSKYATLGLQLAVGQYLAPALTKLITTFAGLVNDVRKMPEPLKITLEAAVALGGGITGLIVVTKAWKAATEALGVVQGAFASKVVTTEGAVAASFGAQATAAEAAAGKTALAVNAEAAAVEAADAKIVAANAAASGSFASMLGKLGLGGLLGKLGLAGAALWTANELMPEGSKIKNLFGGNQPGEGLREGEGNFAKVGALRRVPGQGHSAGYLAAPSGESTEKTIYDFLRGVGLSSAGAAGALGNFMQESSLNSRTNTPEGFGLASWTASSGRKAQEAEYAKSIGLPATAITAQLNFVLKELEQRNPDLFKHLKSATDPQQAAVLFNKYFEGGTDPEGKREKYAREAYAAHPPEAARNLGYYESAAHAGKKVREHAAKVHKALTEHVQNYTKWAEQMVGRFPESTGQNTGPELDKLQAEFHTHAASWCAEFATTAAVMGGANKAVRTASVATIREWAEQGSHGYQKGVSHTPQKGSLMMFGNQHVGVVSSVDQRSGTVSVIEGNANDPGGVVRRNRRISEGDYAMPKYAAKAEEGALQLGLSSKALSHYVSAAEKARHSEEAIAKKILTEHEKIRTALIGHIAKWGEAMDALRTKMGEMVETAGRAWNTLQSKAISDKHADAIRGIETGPEAVALKAEKEADEAHEAIITERELKKSLKEAKGTGNKLEIEKAQEALTKFYTQQQERRREKAIEAAKQAADSTEKTEAESLEERTKNYEAMLNKQLEALFTQLSKAKIGYAKFNAEVDKLLPPGMHFTGGTEPAGGVIPYLKEIPQSEGGGFIRVGAGKASGGLVVPGVSYPVGERGMEWFTSSVPGYITPHGQTPAGQAPGSGNGVGGVHFYGPVAMGSKRDADRLAAKIGFRLRYG